jgi:hypothetical protein
MHRVEAAAIHALKYDHVPACVRDAARDRNSGLGGFLDSGGHHLTRARVG